MAESAAEGCPRPRRLIISSAQTRHRGDRTRHLARNAASDNLAPLRPRSLRSLTRDHPGRRRRLQHGPHTCMHRYKLKKANKVHENGVHEYTNARGETRDEQWHVTRSSVRHFFQRVLKLPALLLPALLPAGEGEAPTRVRIRRVPPIYFFLFTFARTHFLPVPTCSTQASTQWVFLNARMKVGSLRCDIEEEVRQMFHEIGSG